MLLLLKRVLKVIPLLELYSKWPSFRDILLVPILASRGNLLNRMDSGISSKRLKLEVTPIEASSNAASLDRVPDEPDGEELLRHEVVEEEEEEPRSGILGGLGGHCSEREVGISQFLGLHNGFTGILKNRYSDFIVHEIREDGQVVYLTNIDLPPAAFKPIETCAELTDLLDADIISKLMSLFEGTSEKKEVVKITVTSMEKEKRTQIHRSVALNYPGLHTNTVEKDGAKYIEVSSVNQSKRRHNDWLYPADYVHFAVYQESKGTFEVVSALSRFLNIRQKNFSYAGSKDRRAISTQTLSLYRIEPEKLLKINDLCMNHSTPIAVGNISFAKDQLKLGQLKGNRFDMVLRDVTFSDAKDVGAAFASLDEKGFINYFGTQRFGTQSVPTPRIGLSILRENWEEAVNLILSPRDRDLVAKNDESTPSFNDCMKLWQETGDPQKVLRQFYWKNSNEGMLLKGLVKGGPANFFSAIAFIPRNNRNLYLHSYQSLIWNKLASHRIQQFGLKVIPGDLLMFDDNVDDVEGEEALKKTKPLFADESNIERATIYDVVLPLPGTQVIAPKNAVGDKLSELLKEDGLALDKFKTKAKVFTFYGGYRKLVIKPQNLTWSLVSYEDPCIRLFPTDLDLLNGVVEKPEDEGSKKAVKLSISLPSSVYATVFIRELLKRDLTMI